jgi:hypothetical protein
MCIDTGSERVCKKCVKLTLFPPGMLNGNIEWKQYQLHTYFDTKSFTYDSCTVNGWSYLYFHLTYQSSFISNHKITGHWMMHISLQKWNKEIWVIRPMWFVLGSYHDGSLACSEFKSPTPEERLKLHQNHRRQSMLHDSLSIHSTGLLSW